MLGNWDGMQRKEGSTLTDVRKLRWDAEEGRVWAYRC